MVTISKYEDINYATVILLNLAPRFQQEPYLHPNILKAVSNDKIIKVGLVGIGGRGSGAAAQAMNADPNVALTSIGDLYEDRIKLRSRILKARGRNKYQVTEETTFVGFDAYKKVIDSGIDVVILTSPQP